MSDNYAQTDLQVTAGIWASAFVPLALLLIVLLVLRSAKETLHPVVMSMVNGLADHSKAYAREYAIAMLFAFSASLSAFYDLFSQAAKSDLDLMSMHQYLALWCKILNPACVAFLAYITKIPDRRAGTTLPPFPPVSNQPFPPRG